MNLSDENHAAEAKKNLEKFRASKDAQKLVAWVQENHKKCDSARERDKRQWYMNLSMYFGNQYVEFNHSARFREVLWTPPVPKNKPRKTVNRIKPMIRTELARILSQKPTASVIPATSEDEDLFAALAGEQVWESLQSRRKFHKHFSQAAFWQVLTGNGFIKTQWDQHAYDRDSGSKGDVTYGSVTPFNLFVPDLREQEIEDQPYIIHAYTRPVEWVNYVFKNVVPEGFKASHTTANTILEEAYLNIGSGQKPLDSCMVYELWAKPGGTSVMPEGGFALMVDSEVVAYMPDGLPYDHQEYPYTKFEHVPTSKFYADSVVVDIISLQKDYNEVRTQIADARKKMGQPQLVAAKGSISPERMTNEGGLVILYRPGMPPPAPLPLQQLPSHILQEQDRILVDIEDITGQHQVSKGNTPPGVTAATAISYLQERDDSYLVHTYQSIEEGVQKVAHQSLSLAVQYWESERLVKTVGEDNSFDSILLSGAQLANGTDIRIEAGSALPQSKAAKQAFIMDLMKMGFIPPNEGLKMLEIGGAQRIIDQLRNDERQAQRENIRLKALSEEDIQMHAQDWQMRQEQGDPATFTPEREPLEVPPVITVNSFDNHQVHIEVHNRYRRGQAFERLPEAVKAQFETHVEMHKRMLEQEQVQNFLNMIPGDGSLEGIPAPEGGGPQPDPESGGMEMIEQQLPMGEGELPLEGMM